MEGFRECFVGAYGEADARAMTRSWSSAMSELLARGGSLARDRAGEITSPVLLIAGELDELATPDVVKDLAARIRGAEAVIVSGAGHGVSWDQPDRLNQTLFEFLSRH